ncbi:MAG: hypothetical protein AAFV19_04540 [Pseudomonadota bacterium]
MSGTGRLALWHDCAPGHEAEFEAWYKTEHLPERLSVPGFLRGRRWEAVHGAPRFFTFYETTGPEVLTSAAYRARLEAPTPLTAWIMADVMRDLSRTICRVEKRAGHLQGGYAMTANGLCDVDIVALAAEPGVARVEVWQAAESAQPMTREEAIRGGDERIDNCLMVETLRAVDAARLASTFGTGQIWHLLCEMTAADLA